MIRFLLPLFILIFCFNHAVGQDLNGKWLTIKDEESYTIPATNIFEFNNNLVIFYDFDKIIESSRLQILKDTIIIQKNRVGFCLLNENKLRLTGKGTINNRDTIFQVDYLRLMPTTTSLSKEQLENLSFEFIWNNTLNHIIFNKNLSKKPFKLSRLKYCNKIRLEKLDKTYFVSVYCYDRREFVFPIINATYDYLILYDFKSKTGEIKATRLEQ